MDYNEYEAKCKEIKKYNDELLDLFASDLSNLSSKNNQKAFV